MPSFLTVPSLAEAAPTRPSNIVFILADDWGWGDLSCHGHPILKTPNIDRLAAEGTDFQQFEVCNPVCSPSRTAFLTGRYPARFSIHQHFASHEDNIKRGMPDWLDPKALTLPRLLQDAGYKTAHFGKWHLTNTWTADQAPLPTAYGYDDTAVFNGSGPKIGPWPAPIDRTIDFIRQNHDKPFFVNLWLHQTHAKVEPAQEWLDKYWQVPEPLRHYVAFAAEADAGIGRVMQTLKELKLDENTLVIFTSDNGPEVPNEDPNAVTHYSRGLSGGQRGQKRSLYGGGVRVPFIVRMPGTVPAGRTDNRSVLSGVDMLPTIGELAGIKLPGNGRPDGVSVIDAFTGKPFARTQQIFWEWRGAQAGDNWPRLGVREGQWRLLMTYDAQRVELYDTYTDWAESRNLADERPDLTQRLVKAALDWKKTLPTEADPTCIATRFIPKSTTRPAGD